VLVFAASVRPPPGFGDRHISRSGDTNLNAIAAAVQRGTILFAARCAYSGSWIIVIAAISNGLRC